MTEGRTPLGIQLAVIGVLVAVVGFLSRNLWFFDDDWDYLTTRAAGDLDAYLEPHAGHWTLWTVPIFRALHQVVGLDYFPWYHLPRLAALGLLALLLWRTLERRGAPPVVAGAATAVFAVLDTSAGHRAISIGNYIVMGVLMVVGLQLVDPAPVTGRRRLVVAVALVVGVMAFSTGGLVTGATVLVVIGSRRLKDWWPALIPPVAVYALWTLGYGPDRADSLTPNPVELPGAMLKVLGVSVGSLVGVGDLLGALLGLAVFAFVGYLAWQRRLDVFDALALTTAVIFLAVTAELRAVADFPLEDRYAFVPIITLALVVVPRIRVPASRTLAVAAGLVAVGVFAVNLHGTRERSQELAEFVADRRPRVETAAALLADGQPAVDDAWVSVPLTVEGLRKLVAEGWQPPVTPDREREARGFLTIGLGPDSDEATEDDLAGDCHTLAAGDEQAFEFDEPSSLVIRAPRQAQLGVTWEGDGVEGERRITWTRGRGQFGGDVGRFPLAVADGGTTTVTVEVLRASDDVEACLIPTP